MSADEGADEGADDGADVPMDETAQWARDELADRFAERTPMTPRQADAYVRREVIGMPRAAAADELGIAPSTLDEHLGKAREHVRVARETVELVDDLGGADQ